MSSRLGGGRGRGAGEVRIEGGIRLQVAAAVWWKCCLKVAAFQ